MAPSRCVRLLGTVLSLLLLTCALASAQPPSPPSDAAPQQLGVLDPVQVQHLATVPRDGLWRPPHGPFVLPESVTVVGGRGARFTSALGDPRKGEYRVRLDGCLRFHRDDRGAKVTVSYQYRPRRVALLPTLVATDYEDAASTLEEALFPALAAHGLAVVSGDDVADAVTKARQSAAMEGTERGSGGWATAAARSLNVAYLLLPSVDANADRVFAGFQSYSSTTGRASTSGGSASAHARTTTTTVPVTQNVMGAAVGLSVFSGETGATVAEVVVSGTKRVRFRQFGPARRSLIRELAPKLVSRWFDSSF